MQPTGSPSGGVGKLPTELRGGMMSNFNDWIDERIKEQVQVLVSADESRAQQAALYKIEQLQELRR